MIEWTPPPDGIYVIKIPDLMRFRFEWHSRSHKVYMIDLGQTPPEGKTSIEAEVVAVEVVDHGAAITAVLIWCRGFRTARRINPSNLQIIGEKT